MWSYLNHESGIVWLENIDRIDYVRVMERAMCRSRHRRPLPLLGDYIRVVGYVILRPDAPRYCPGWFHRRLFWLANHDRDRDPNGVYAIGIPGDAVDPRTVLPGEPGRPTRRAWFGRKRLCANLEAKPYPRWWWTDEFYRQLRQNSSPNHHCGRQ